MAQVSVVAGGVPVTLNGEENSSNRRKANHPPNLWTDDFIQSLSSQYGASSYCERVQTLIEEVKYIFKCLLEDAETTSSPESLLHRLSIIDIVERFGIERYFRKEIKATIETVYMWDNLILGGLPDYMKITFEFAHKILDEIAIEAERNHGPRVHKYMQKYWESYILSYLKEVEWIATNHIPTFDEYMKNGAISIAVPTTTMYLLILIDTFIPEDMLVKIEKIETLVSSCSRLLDDSRDYEDEKLHGQNASCIECYVKDNPGSKREDALNHINTLLDSGIEELKWEIFSHKGIPSFCKKVYFDALLRGYFFIFKDVDGLSLSHKEVKDAIMNFFVEPIYM